MAKLDFDLRTDNVVFHIQNLIEILQDAWSRYLKYLK